MKDPLRNPGILDASLKNATKLFKTDVGANELEGVLWQEENDNS